MTGSDEVVALVPAAGRGVRLGKGTPKALRDLAGQPLLAHALRGLDRCADVTSVVVAAAEPDVPAVRALLERAELRCASTVVAGGESRQESVGRALAAVHPDSEWVLVHDAARPLVPVEVVQRVVGALRSGSQAVIPVVPVADTIKRVEDDVVIDTVDRTALRAAQTPQGFRRSVLASAHDSAAVTALTDDAGLVEALGVRVDVVDGAAEAFKITDPLDMLVAETLLAR